MSLLYLALTVSFILVKYSEQETLNQHCLKKLEDKNSIRITIVGQPNVGKSTLLKTLTSAKPKIGNYEFTTLNPNIGVLKGDIKDYLIADIPGLIKGSSLGKGLGYKFLKHIERSKFLIEVLDLSCGSIVELKKQHLTLMNELSSYNKNLPGKVKLILLNKIDLCCFTNEIPEF